MRHTDASTPTRPSVPAGQAEKKAGLRLASAGSAQVGGTGEQKALGGFVMREMAFIQKWMLTPKICNQQGARQGLNSPFRLSSDLHLELSNSLHLFITSTSWCRTNSALEVLWTYSKARFSFLGHSNSSSPWRAPPSASRGSAGSPLSARCDGTWFIFVKRTGVASQRGRRGGSGSPLLPPC